MKDRLIMRRHRNEQRLEPIWKTSRMISTTAISESDVNGRHLEIDTRRQLVAAEQCCLERSFHRKFRLICFTFMIYALRTHRTELESPCLPWGHMVFIDGQTPGYRRRREHFTFIKLCSHCSAACAVPQSTSKEEYSIQN